MLLIPPFPSNGGIFLFAANISFMSTVFTYMTKEKDMPVTLGKFLARQGYSQDLLSALRQSDGVRVNDAFRRMIEPLAANERIVVTMPEDELRLIANNELSLPVLYEDDWLLAVDKPDDILVHPAGRGFDDAVGNFFCAHCPNRGFRPLGRLDRHTTGVCLIAKDRLTASLLGRNIDKDYFAAAQGIFDQPQGRVDIPLIRVPGPAIKRVADEKGKRCITCYQVLDTIGELSFLKLKLITGRTHQIRAHMSCIGHPLAGDSLYGGSTRLIGRQALHCGCLRFFHPHLHKDMEIVSPLPCDIQKLLSL